MTRTQCLGLCAILTATAPAQAGEQTTFYDAQGRVSGRAAADSGGATSFYDAQGRPAGRSYRSNGTSYFYDAAGRPAGSAAMPRDEVSR